MKKFLTTLCLSLLCIIISNVSVVAQSVEQQRDSLLLEIQNATADTTKANIYVDLTYLYIPVKPNKAVEYAQSAITIAKKINNPKILKKAYRGISQAYRQKGAEADTLLYFIKLYEGVDAPNSKNDSIDIHWMYSDYYAALGKLDKKLEEHLKTLKLLRRYNGSTNEEGKLLNGIGATLYLQGKVTDALKYYKKGIELFSSKDAKATMLTNIGFLYQDDLKELDTAQIYFDEALVLFREVNNLGGIAAVLLSKGDYHDTEGRFEQAYNIYMEAAQIIRENNFGYFEPELNVLLGNHYFLQKKYRQSIVYSEKYLRETNLQAGPFFLQTVYAALESSYAAIGDYKKAFEVRGEFMSLKDSLSEREVASKVEELQTQFEVEQTETENKLLKAETQANQKTIRSRNVTVLALILGLLLAATLGFMIYRSALQKQKYNQELEATVARRTKELQQANYELRTFNYIASHDIKEPIRNIGNYAGLVFKQLPDNLKEKFSFYFDTIKLSTSQLYTLVEDFAKYTTMSRDEAIDKQSVHLNKLVDGLEQSLHGSIQKYNGQVLRDDLPIIQSSGSLLYTALKNLIENGLKYNRSAVSTVKVSYNKTQTHHQIIVTDNGIGIPEEYHEKVFEMFKRLHNRSEYEGSGIGLAIVKLVTDKLNGTVRIESASQYDATINNGSRFIIELPIE